MRKKLTFSKINFLNLKYLSPGQRAATHADITEFQTFCCNLKITSLQIFYIFNFERNYDVLNSKSLYILLNKYITLIKTKRNWKWKITHTVLERRTLYSYKNRKLKVKLWWVGARVRKMREFVVPFTLFEGHFFNICVLSQCIVYWMHFSASLNSDGNILKSRSHQRHICSF